MSEVCVRPSPKMKKLIYEIHGSINAAATVWGVEYLSLRRFMEGGTMSLPAAAQIVERSGVPYEELFEHTEKGAKR